MLIPKSLFIGFASFAGIGSLVPLSTALVGGGHEPNTWRLSTNSSFPLLTCKQGSAKVWISLELKDKNNPPHLSNDKEIIFVGHGNTQSKQVQEIDFEDTVGEHGTFRLIIWPNSGTNIFGELGSWDSYQFGDALKCEKNIFKITETTRSTYLIGKNYDKGFKQIKLLLDKCHEKEGKRECEIKIEGNVGLEWSDDFKPKVIL